MFLLSALLVGFLGSFHCAGMCGPIALALPFNASSKPAIFFGRLLYNSGRIVTYTSLGIVAGLVGHNIAIAGFQKSLTIATGIIIIAIAVGSLFMYKLTFFNSWLLKFSSRLKKLFRKFFGQKSYTGLFLIGTVNGLLPCGFVYLALAAAVGSPSGMPGATEVLESAGYMMVFGLGTLPMMLFISLAGNLFGMRFNNFARKATPFVAMAVAILLIARGVTISNASCCHRH